MQSTWSVVPSLQLYILYRHLKQQWSRCWSWTQLDSNGSSKIIVLSIVLLSSCCCFWTSFLYSFQYCFYMMQCFLLTVAFELAFSLFLNFSLCGCCELWLDPSAPSEFSDVITCMWLPEVHDNNNHLSQRQANTYLVVVIRNWSSGNMEHRPIYSIDSRWQYFRS